MTEEFAPGFRASPGAYVLSMLRDAVWHDMRLRERGLHVDQAGPSLNVYADGQTFVLDGDRAQASMRSGLCPLATRACSPSSRRRSSGSRRRADARVRLDRAGSRCGGCGISRVCCGSDGWRFDSGTISRRPRFLFTTSAKQYLDEHFESEVVKSALVGSPSATRSRGRRRQAPRTACCTGRLGGFRRWRRMGVRAGRDGNGDGAHGRRGAGSRSRDPYGRRGGAGADGPWPRDRCRARRR